MPIGRARGFPFSPHRFKPEVSVSIQISSSSAMARSSLWMKSGKSSGVISTFTSERQIVGTQLDRSEPLRVRDHVLEARRDLLLLVLVDVALVLEGTKSTPAEGLRLLDPHRTGLPLAAEAEGSGHLMDLPHGLRGEGGIDVESQGRVHTGVVLGTESPHDHRVAGLGLFLLHVHENHTIVALREAVLGPGVCLRVVLRQIELFVIGTSDIVGVHACLSPCTVFWTVSYTAGKVVSRRISGNFARGPRALA